MTGSEVAGGGGPAERGVPEEWWRVATLTLLTVTVAVGFARVFDSGGFLVPLIATALLGHAVAAATRRIPVGLSTLAMLLAGGVVTIDLTYRTATTFGVPTRATFTVIRHSLHGSIDLLRHGSAPVAPDPGLVFGAAVLLWIVAWSADRLTFSFDAPVEALVPSATTFVVVTSLAGPDHRWSSAALYGAAVILHVLVGRRSAVPHHGAPRPTVDTRELLRGGVLAGAALCLGLGAAATVPALDPDGLLPLRDSHTVTVVSPLVDIRSRLVDQSDQVLFTVASTRPAYWRLMALDSFDGSAWTPPNTRVPVARSFLDRDSPVTPFDPDRVSATFDLSGLGGAFAPTVFQATALSEVTDRNDPSVARQLLWDKATSTLIASADTSTVTGLQYTVSAEVPQVSASELRRATAPVPAVIERNETRLPDDFPDDLRTLARSIVADAGATTPYAKALALQNFFREGHGFVYSTDIPEAAAGESSEAIRAFLRDRVGFCEQFAGTFGALARAVGLPTRLAVGFTWGDAVPTTARRATGPTTYTVTGRDAHAWPEVYFSGVGWLPFEPTPGRGNPSASSYTGVDAAQALPGPTVNGSTSSVPTPTTAPATPPATTVPGGTAPVQAAPVTPTAKTPPPGHGDVPTGLLAGVAVLVVLVLSIGPLTRAVRRSLRRRTVTGPAAEVRLVWDDTVRAWRSFGVVRTEVDTDRDLGDRLGALLRRLDPAAAPADTDAARRLAAAAGAAAWHAEAVTPADAEVAAADAARLTRIARRHRTRRARITAWFDPR